MDSRASFDVFASIVRARRTVKADQMNGTAIPDEEIRQILALADWAPTHGRTEPWRFFVYTRRALEDFCRTHGEWYRESPKFQEHKYEKMRRLYQHASHLVVVVMKRSDGSKIPAEEEYAACCAGIQNMLLAAQALGISTIWSTGGMTYSEELKTYLGAGPDDRVVGLVYFGYSDRVREGARKIPLSEKTRWNEK